MGGNGGLFRITLLHVIYFKGAFLILLNDILDYFFPLKVCIRGIYLISGLLENGSFTFRLSKPLSMLKILFPLNFVDITPLTSPFIVISDKSTTCLILICFFLWT